VLFEAARARRLYAEGLELLGLLDHRSRAFVAAMAGIYRRLLGRIEAHHAAVLQTRVSLPAWEKAWVAARSLAGAGV
jgi:phytoene synthase